MKRTGGQTRLFGLSWWIGLGLFLAFIGWMFVDIMQREGNFGDTQEVLIMGTNAGFKPFEYREGAEVVGFDVDLAREIAKSMGKELRVEDMSFDGLLPALDAGRVDMVIAGMSMTPERAKNVLFSDAYYTASQRIIVKKGSSLRTARALEGRKIGVQLGTTGDTLASKISGAKVAQFPSVPTVLSELAIGGVDAVILDDAPAAQYIRGFPSLEIVPGELSSEQYAIAIKQGNDALKQTANQVIRDMKQDGRYDALIRKYFGESAAGARP